MKTSKQQPVDIVKPRTSRATNPTAAPGRKITHAKRSTGNSNLMDISKLLKSGASKVRG